MSGHPPDVPAVAVAVCRRAEHSFTKDPQPAVRLVAGLGVDGDAHAGATVKHRSRVAKDPARPNLRQVHLVAAELHAELHALGYAGIGPGALGENITTRGIDLAALPRGARLRLGADAVVEVTGLRNPCVQIERYARGLLAAVRGRDAGGHVVMRSAVMGIVVESGEVRAGDPIDVRLPPLAHQPLARV